MDTSRFDTSVTVTSRTAGANTSVSTPAEAMDYLLNAWLGKRHEAHRKAVQACHDAMSGERSAAAARRAFVSATRQAGLLVSA